MVKPADLENHRPRSDRLTFVELSRGNMGILTNLFGRSLGSASELWVADSIYAFVKKHIDPASGRLDARGEALPDEELRGGSKLRWADGALDGTFGHHGASSASTAIAKRLALQIDRLARTGNARAEAVAYALLKDEPVLELIDPLLEALKELETPIEPHLSEFALKLATQSRDRGPVKTGIALLGAMRAQKHEEIVTVLGKHEEFTLFSAVALSNMFDDASERLWALAKTVEGWGRIHLVERMVPTDNPQIQRWLRLEGYRNSVLYEYLALTAAIHGRLRDALSAPQVDDTDLMSAAEVIDAMIAAENGAAAGINSYPDAAASTLLYLQHISTAPLDLLHFLTANVILQYREEDDRTDADKLAQGWSESALRAVTANARDYIARPEWDPLIRAALDSDDPVRFDRANRAAKIKDIDTYEWHFHRLQRNPLDSSAWFNAMQAATQKRIDDLVSIAERGLPLDQIASGPGTQLGLGEEFAAHACLDFILQDLKHFPGKGLRLIATGLRSPVIRNRHMAINALEAYEPDLLREHAREIIERALREEVDEDVRGRLADLKAVLEKNRSGTR